MASSLYGESRRKYSWWWDSHISPKNSKWLQDNLTDMDRNVKAMIKLIEEDADSFAKRAEMYYKKRPELMKIVEEFYRAYRALAERYDNATGALRQAHKTMAEAFPNQIPSMMSDDSPSSVTEFYPVSPEMSSPIRGFLDFDDSSSSKKGLKQLKEMFPFNEGSIRKALSFKEEEEGFKSETKLLQEEISQLSLKNENLMREMTLESQHARALQEIVYKCESGKQDALCRYKNSIERLAILESGISNTRHKLNEVHDQMTVQLNSVKEQFHAMEGATRSVRLKLKTQQEELNKKALELEELCVVIEKEQEKRLQAEVALMSLEQMNVQSQDENERLSLEAQCVTDKLKDMETSKAVLEERINEHIVIISNLQEQNLSYDAKIKDMQNEMQLLKAAKEKVEYELNLNMKENKTLRKEVKGLENSLSSANVEIEGLKVSSNALEAFCETLVSEISTHSVEKGVLVSHMESIADHMEGLEVKNNFLENLLSDMGTELENLKARFKDMEENRMSLCDKNTILLSEKNSLVSQVENLGSKYLKLQNKYSDVEKERDSKTQELLDLQSSLSQEKREQDAVVSSMSSQLELLHNQISCLKADFEMEQHQFMNSSLGCFILQNCLHDMKDKHLFLFGEYQSVLEASTCAENQISCLKHAELNLKGDLTSLMERNKELEEGYHLLIDALKVNAENRTVDKGLVQSILDKIRNTLASVTEYQDENGKLHLEVAKLDNLYLQLLDKHSKLIREKDAISHQLIELQETSIQEKEHYESLVAKLKKEINCSTENIRVEQQNVIDSLYEVFVLQSCLCDMKDTNLSLLRERADILEEYRSAKNQIVELKNKEVFQIREIETLSVGNAALHKGIHLLLDELNVDVNDINAKGTGSEMTLRNIFGEIKNLKNSVCNFQDENKQLQLKVQNLDSCYLELLEKHFILQRDKDAISHQLHELQTSLIRQKEHHETLFSTLNEEINRSVENFEVEHQKVMHYLFENFVLQRCLCEMKDTNLCLLRERCHILDAFRQAENVITKLKNKELLKISEIETLSEYNVVLHKGIHMLLEEFNIDLNAVDTEGTIDEVTLQNILGEVKNMKISVSVFGDENKHLLLKTNNLESNLLALREEYINLEREKYILQNHVQLLQKENQDIDRDFEMEQQRTANADIEILVLQGCVNDMCDKNLLLADKCDCENLNHKKELNLILEALEIDIQNVTKGNSINKVTLQTILSKIINLASCLSDAHDENQRLSVEKLVFGAILNQIRLDNLHLFNELEHRTLELHSSEIKRNEIMGMNEELKVENDNFLSQIEVLRGSVDILETKCLELEDKRSVLKTENEELENSLKFTVNEHHALILSSKNQLAYFETQFHKLKKETVDKEVELCNESEHLHLEVKSVGQDLEILKRQYSGLEIKAMNLERENEVLEKFLKLEKQGHSALVSSSKSQISSLENQVNLVQKERSALEDELLTEQQNTMNALLENFILRGFLLDTKDTNLALCGEYQNLKRQHSELEEMTMSLEKENEDLEKSLKLQKQEHNALMSSSKSQISILENQVDIFQEEKITLEDESLAEQLRTMNVLFENFILQRSLVDIKGTNLSLSGKYQNLKRQYSESQEKTMKLEKKIEDLEKFLKLEMQEHNALISSSKSQISTLENQLDLVQKERMTLEDELLAEQQKRENALLRNFILQRCLVDTKNMNLALSGEYQNLLEASRYSDKLILGLKYELESQSIELLSTQNQRNEAEKMIHKANTEVEILSKELAKLHNYNNNLETEVCKLREEKNLSLARLEVLETENSVILAEAMKLEQLYIFFKSISIERGFKLKFAINLANDLNKTIETKKNMLTQKEMEIYEFQKENDRLYENLETAVLFKKELENEIRALSSCLSSKDEDMIKYEGEIYTLLSDCSISVLYASALEDKVYELVQECERLDFLSILHEEKLREQISINKVLERKLESLERENDDLKADLKSSFDAIACIDDHVISLANLSGIQDDSLMVVTEENEGSDDPHKWVVKAKLLEKVIRDVHYLLDLERSDSRAKIESLMEEIEELKLKKSPFGEFTKEKYTQTMKDIQLDQASHSYKVSNNESDDQMLELWEENTEDDIAEEIKSEYPSCDVNVEKQNTFARVHDNESPRAWSKVCSKKLNSDLNKLLMIQKNLQEYKVKLESLEKKKQLKSAEYSNLKEHIQDAGMAILEQVDIYATLIHKVEEDFESSNAVIWEKERRLISEQAREGSVKIEKLESELKKIEYIVLKVQEEEENKRKMYLERRSSSTLLSEFIYSENEVMGKKKGRFCRCIRPKTKK